MHGLPENLRFAPYLADVPPLNARDAERAFSDEQLTANEQRRLSAEIRRRAALVRCAREAALGPS